MRRRLHGIRVEEHALRFAERSYLRDRLHRSHLVVREHDAHKSGVLPDGVLYVLNVYDAVRLRRDVCYFKALFLELFHGMQYSVVLYVERYEVLLALWSKPPCRGQQGLVVRLRTAAGKIHLIWFRCVDALRDYLSGLIQNFLCALSVAVQAVWVAVELIKTLNESVSCRLAQIRGRGIVSIYSH